MRWPGAYTLFCLLVLVLFVFAKFQGYALFGTPNPAAASGSTRSGSSGYHK